MSNASDYLLQGAQDFVRLDNRCHQLLKEFAAWLQTPAGDQLPPEQAGAAAHTCDRYLRDFIVEFKETGPADEDPGLVRQYLGNWYILHTLQPEHDEIDQIVAALRRLYTFLGQQGVVSSDAAAAFRRSLEKPQYFHARLEDFWALTGEQIPAWRAIDDYRQPARPE